MGKGTVHDREAVQSRAIADSGVASAEEAGAGLGNQIVRFTRLVAARRHQTKLEQGAGERVLLARLVRDGERRATDLAADTFLDLSTVSRQVRSMVERGLIERRPDPEDRRGTLLYATESGRAVYEKYRQQRDAQLAELLGPWPPEDRYQLIRLMTRLNDDLVEHQHNRHGEGTHPAAVAQQGASTYE
ncbi:MarR family transcriptional regulator [Streptomyces sp. SID8379]|uniref:MarR family winged helix-turn-helix transcriptional regulator n=1 Tax=unclassified Streptomyces TaxID=2593676 RepID=UPI00047725EB|nr:MULTISPECIES: MarR family winged helix-turn-helix transcriptional regulator [unclassified Streptomyces]MYW69363.1 MarR family transcriptional regulator [Streptomyces sp. SID8379]MYW69402.1 MarR family transcriptional regulator [Streptomyces sp. SID8379]